MFGLCQIHAFVDYLRSRMPKDHFEILFKTLVSSVISLALIIGTVLTITGKVSPWTGRFYSLLDPSYAKNHIPIIASVSEHQPTSWSSFYFDLQVKYSATCSKASTPMMTPKYDVMTSALMHSLITSTLIADTKSFPPIQFVSNLLIWAFFPF